jgi:hypothetical protein
VFASEVRLEASEVDDSRVLDELHRLVRARVDVTLAFLRMPIELGRLAIASIEEVAVRFDLCVIWVDAQMVCQELDPPIDAPFLIPNLG